MNQNVIKHLKKLRKEQKNFKVQTFISFPCPWIDINNKKEVEEYIKEYGFFNHREILDHEIVIDVDTENKEYAEKHASLIENKLIKNNYKYSKFYSGGDGIHFHLFFDKNRMYKLINIYGISIVREEFLKYLGYPYLYLRDDNNEIKSHICLHNKRLIQLEYMKHRKGNIKTFLSGSEQIDYNDVPEELIILIDKKITALIKKNKELKEKFLDEDITEMNCIKFIKGETINEKSLYMARDGLYRLMFAYISLLIRQGYDEEYVIRTIKDWKNTMPSDWLLRSSRKVNDSLIEYTVRKNNGLAKCKYIRKILEDIRCNEVCLNCPLNVYDT